MEVASYASQLDKTGSFQEAFTSLSGRIRRGFSPHPPVSPPRSFCVSAKSRAHASFAFSRIRIGQLNPLCPTQMRRTLIPGQLDFFNLVNGQGGTNKKPTHPAFALPTRIDGSVRVHIFFRLTGLYLRLALAFRNRPLLACESAVGIPKPERDRKAAHVGPRLNIKLVPI